ncbi:MAG TPA: hypothetical protein VMB71_15435 [Acetobacteraceae bacterium]|nr:hypothetical protein [Acetobacteraceae bacterium]
MSGLAHLRKIPRQPQRRLRRPSSHYPYLILHDRDEARVALV